MKSPTSSDINRTLRQIESTERDDSHPRRLARQAIAKWKSNAERDGLPITNTHDDKGAPVLDRDEVLKWNPTHMGRK